MEPLLSSIEELTGRGTAWLTAGIGSFGLGILCWQRTKLAGTTLVAPWCWSLAALAALAATEIAIAGAGSPMPDWAPPLRFAAAVGTLCPAMALMGAKRPQNRGWQLIVLSLWAILCLPSLEWLLFGGPRDIHPARSWFLAILVGVTAVNGLGARFWPSSLLYCAGQLVLVIPFLTTNSPLGNSVGPIWGLGGIVLAWALMAAGWPRPAPARAPLDRVWLDFRDAFGMVWALRVMERINAAARMYDWPVRLSWHGFHDAAQGEAGQGGAHQGDAQQSEPVDVPLAVEKSLRSLLRRFVSPAWIEARLGRAAAGPTVDDNPLVSQNR